MTPVYGEDDLVKKGGGYSSTPRTSRSELRSSATIAADSTRNDLVPRLKVNEDSLARAENSSGAAGRENRGRT